MLESEHAEIERFEALFEGACFEYDITPEEAAEMTDAERSEAADLFRRQTEGDGEYDPVAYYNSIEYADADPYGWHIEHDVL